MSLAIKQASITARTRLPCSTRQFDVLGHLFGTALSLRGPLSGSIGRLPVGHSHKGSSNDVSSTSTKPPARSSAPRRIPTRGSLPSRVIASIYLLLHCRRAPSIAYLQLVLRRRSTMYKTHHRDSRRLGTERSGISPCTGHIHCEPVPSSSPECNCSIDPR